MLSPVTRNWWLIVLSALGDSLPKSQTVRSGSR
jgi:hypothetical protein